MRRITAQNPVAYFCAEFGIDANIPIYAGGLGILSGDTIKEAADRNYPFIGVGLLYQGELSKQIITNEGEQKEVDFEYDPAQVGLEPVYLNDMPLFIKVHLTQVDVWLRCWKKQLSENVALYLLDPNTEQNHPHERRINQALYYGTEEELIKQQLVLGIGGVKLLHALGINPEIYHINEGRPSFAHWQIIRNYMDKHYLDYESAKTQARKKTVYTNHTLVSAGNQTYDIDLLKVYGKYYSEKMGISIDQLLRDGFSSDNRFCVTTFALNTSRKASSVSKLHYEICKKNWPEYNWCNATNGVHMPTWQDERMRQASLENNEVWFTHQELKKEASDYFRSITGYGYDPNRLVITWARRFASYKRPNLIFQDFNRIKNIMLSTQRPVQLLVAGKAHTFDVNTKQMIKQMIGYFSKELAGHALFIPNYNMEIAKRLVTGSDIWLNTPEYGKEACGTSGMKAISNGVIQMTITDGWAYEVAWDNVGWQLDPVDTANNIYYLLENQILPMYYRRDEQGIPQNWLTKMKNSIKLSQKFATKRMFNEYIEKLYK